MSLIVKEEEFENKQIAKCICKIPFFCCPYHFHNYSVYLCGSWNDWVPYNFEEGYTGTDLFKVKTGA